MATAPVHLKAFFAVLFRRKPVWRVTNQRALLPTACQLCLPQIALLLINATAVVVGLTIVENATTTAITVALCVVHILILGRVVLQAAADRRRSAEDAVVADGAEPAALNDGARA